MLEFRTLRSGEILLVEHGTFFVRQCCGHMDKYPLLRTQEVLASKTRFVHVNRQHD